MKSLILLFLLICPYGSCPVQAQEVIQYSLKHVKGEGEIQITIELPEAHSNSLTLIIPRSAPGTYEMTDYCQFILEPMAHDVSGSSIEGVPGLGSYFTFSSEKSITSITYKVDINTMENTLLGAYSSSRVRPNYLGILGYSVFGFIKEYQYNPIELTIETEKTWPIFSTLQPGTNMLTGMSKYTASSFDALADAQYMAGTELQIWHSNDGPVPFYLTMYSETPSASKELIGQLGLDILNKLDAYFGFTPMPHYVMHLEYLIPLSVNYGYGFWMEHMNSMTGFSDTSNVITKDNFRALGIAHHMGHSWIPLRSYGEGYRPFSWEVAPLIETIWFNEGFIWYAAGVEVLGQDRLIDFFKTVVSEAPDFISKLSLKDLSLLGSTQYGHDFRIGRNLFSRGALLAYDLDNFVQAETGGKKSFKDVILAVYNWSQVNQRAFRYEEFPGIISEGVGVDVSMIWEKWEKSIEN